MDIDLTDICASNLDKADHAATTLDLVPEARQTYPSEDDALRAVFH